MINNSFKKIGYVLGISLFLASCAGRAPNPMSVVRPGDDTLSCTYMQSELSEIEGKIQRLIPESEKTGKNVALGVTGVLFIVPLFFMDFSDAEKVELEALRSRYNHIARLYNDKACSKTPANQMVLQER